MNIANVDERFMMLSGVKPDEMCRWRGLVEDALAYIEAHSTVDSPDEAQTGTLNLRDETQTFIGIYEYFAVIIIHFTGKDLQ